MNFRENQLTDPWERTFEWLLPEPTPDNDHVNAEARAKFCDWLNKDEQELFWICGKAGSGKSTMMKRLFQHPQIQQSVKTWANPCPVAFASFYFYQRGNSVLQKSNEGLLRALLYQVLKQVPSLSAPVMEALPPPGDYSTSLETFEWKFDSLRKAIENIKDYSSRTGEVKFCIFIDGLDEYQSFDELMQEESNVQGKLATNTWESYNTSSSPWQLALSLSVALLSYNPLIGPLPNVTETNLRSWKRDTVIIIEIFLNAGADVNAQVPFSFRTIRNSYITITPLEAVSMWTARPVERDRILQMIRDRLANQSSELTRELA